MRQKGEWDVRSDGAIKSRQAFLKFPGPVEKIWRSDKQAEQRGVCVTAQDGNAVR